MRSPTIVDPYAIIWGKHIFLPLTGPKIHCPLGKNIPVYAGKEILPKKFAIY